jgi:hypothetical protein
MDAETKRYIDQQIAKLKKEILAEIKKSISLGKKSQNNNYK